MKKGYKASNETKEKISKALTGIKRPAFTEEHRKRLSESHKGQVAWCKGKRFSEEHKRKLSEAWKTRKVVSRETRLKMSLSRKGRITWIKGKKHSLETRKKMSLAQRRENNANWKDGITSSYELIRKSLRNQVWHRAVFERDNYACVWCGDNRGGNLEADHIIPFSKIIEKLKFEQGIDNLYEKAMNYELFWDINNGRTLCEDCHKKTNTWGVKAKHYKLENINTYGK